MLRKIQCNTFYSQSVFRLILAGSKPLKQHVDHKTLFTETLGEIISATASTMKITVRIIKQTWIFILS